MGAKGKAERTRGKARKRRRRRGVGEAANVGGSLAVYRYFVPVMETRVVSCCCLIVVETHARCASWAGRTRVGVKTFHRAVGQSGTDENHHATKSRRRSRRAHCPRRKTLAALVRAPSASRQHTRPRPPARDAYRAPCQPRRLAHTRANRIFAPRPCDGRLVSRRSTKSLGGGGGSVPCSLIAPS